MNTQDQLEAAIAFALYVHLGQKDKGGELYILHPLHLMSKFLYDKELATIAVLHDVLEDSGKFIASKRLHADYSDRVCEAVELLTHKQEDDYTKYIAKITNNLDAIKVKLADLQHNLDLSRLQKITDKDCARFKKYKTAILILKSAESIKSGLIEEKI